MTPVNLNEHNKESEFSYFTISNYYDNQNATNEETWNTDEKIKAIVTLILVITINRWGEHGEKGGGGGGRGKEDGDKRKAEDNARKRGRGGEGGG